MTVAVDTTGFRNDTASAYYQSRCGRKRRSWHKGGFAVGTASQLIVGMRVWRGSGSDAQWLAPLRAKARRYVGRTGRSARFWLLADAGFDGREVAWTDVVLPIRRGGSVAGVVAAGIVFYASRRRRVSLACELCHSFGRFIRSAF